jgi:hypothetical protein
LPHQEEALSWLLGNKNKSAFAANHFNNNDNAIDAVKTLYAAGAVKVDIIVRYDEPWRVESEGGEYADIIEVTFPDSGRDKIIAAIEALKPDNFEDTPGEGNESPYSGPYSGLDHTKTIRLWWD